MGALDLKSFFLVVCIDNGRSAGRLNYFGYLGVSLDLYNIKNGACEKLLQS